MNGKKQIKYLGISAFIAALIAVFGFISLSWNESGTQKTLIVICSILLTVLCGIYLYIIWLSVDREPNYFLYDRISKRNIHLSSLTWKIVDTKLNGYIYDKFGGTVHLWTNNIISDTKKLSGDGVFQTLIAYKMLCDVALDTDGNYFELFNNADVDLVCWIGGLIEKNGDADMARAIINYKSCGGNIDKFRRYLKNNAKYIQSRMVIYVRKNIEKFY